MTPEEMERIARQLLLTVENLKWLIAALMFLHFVIVVSHILIHYRLSRLEGLAAGGYTEAMLARVNASQVERKVETAHNKLEESIKVVADAVTSSPTVVMPTPPDGMLRPTLPPA